MYINIGELKEGDIVRVRNDTYQVSDPGPHGTEDGSHSYFYCHRFVKTRQAYAKSQTALRYGPGSVAEKVEI